VSLTTLIVDDEALAREGLRMLLSQDTEVSAIREAKDGREALASIRSTRPDLVFLDVQMPEMDGFAVLQALGAEQMPAVVLVTAHDRYAIKAFELNAIDYLLKPVTEERFAKSLARAKARIRAGLVDDANRQIIGLLETIASPRRYPRRLSVRSTGRIVFVDVDDVDYVRAAENYVEVHLGRVHHLLHVPMSTLEEALDPEVFLRIHRSTIVNASRIKEVKPGAHGEYVVTLEDGTKLQSGRSYSGRLRALSSNPF
jgi:two-component system, LytTR family, response regulator